MYYKTAGACVADSLVQVDVLLHGACYSPDPSSSFSPKCSPGNAFKTEQVPSYFVAHHPQRGWLACP
jgi:hypothetical protein